MDSTNMAVNLLKFPEIWGTLLSISSNLNSNIADDIDIARIFVSLSVYHNTSLIIVDQCFITMIKYT